MLTCAYQITAELREGYDESLTGSERIQRERIHVSSPHISLSKGSLNCRIWSGNAVQPRAWKVEIFHLVMFTWWTSLINCHVIPCFLFASFFFCLCSHDWETSQEEKKKKRGGGGGGRRAGRSWGRGRTVAFCEQNPTLDYEYLRNRIKYS